MNAALAESDVANHELNGEAASETAAAEASDDGNRLTSMLEHYFGALGSLQEFWANGGDETTSEAESGD